VSRSQEVVFKKPNESSQHIKPLYVRGHFKGKPISRMLTDGSTAVNLMPNSIFKKLSMEDDEFMKTNLTFDGMGDSTMEARTVVSMELTIGSKSLATAFFII
jgi:hypothetical protein